MALQHEVTPAATQVTSFAPDPALDDDTDDEFEDATDAIEHTPDTDNHVHGLLDCDVAIKKFLNNDIKEAQEILMPRANQSMYHALGTAVLEFIPAILTLEPEKIAKASEALKRTVRLSQGQRKTRNIVNVFNSFMLNGNGEEFSSSTEFFNDLLQNQHLESYTDMEAHAELVTAEAQLLQAMLNIIEDEDLRALFTSSIKIRNCYAIYKRCQKLLEVKPWTSLLSRKHFESGVLMGIGTFKLMVSLLPSRFIFVLEIVGFVGDREQGLKDLETGSRLGGLRNELSDMVLLTYHLIICYYIGLKGDLAIAEKIITQRLKEHPNGVWYLLFQSRLLFMRGRFTEAISGYHQAISSQHVWKQIHHLCYWDLIWLHSMRCEWRKASSYAEQLHDDSPWSRTCYSYLRAALLLQDSASPSELDRRLITDHMRSASRFKQRIAGKSLPMEKFVLKRCQRYMAQRGNLVLPAIEMMAMWNVFDTIGENRDAGHSILAILSATKEKFRQQRFTWELGYEGDNRALIHYLEGCVLRSMGSYARSVAAFEDVLLYKDSLNEDLFLIPYAKAEMAICLFELGQKATASQILTDIKKKFSGYALESRLHFRMHSMALQYKKKTH